MNKNTEKQHYYSWIGSYLDKVKLNKNYFSRIDLIDFVNRYVPAEKRIKMDLFFDAIIKDYYRNYAADVQKELLDNYLIKTFVDKDFIIDEKSVDVMPMALDIENLNDQNQEILKKFDELNQKTPHLSVQTFNNMMEELEQRINSIKEEYVFSLTGSSKVEATYKNAESIYSSYVGLIDGYKGMKFEIQR